VECLLHYIPGPARQRACYSRSILLVHCALEGIPRICAVANICRGNKKSPTPNREELYQAIHGVRVDEFEAVRWGAAGPACSCYELPFREIDHAHRPQIHNSKNCTPCPRLGAASRPVASASTRRFPRSDNLVSARDHRGHRAVDLRKEGPWCPGARGVALVIQLKDPKSPRARTDKPVSPYRRNPSTSGE